MAETSKPRGFTRRNFIKGAAVLGAAGTLVGCAPKADDKEPVEPVAAESPDEIYSGVCRGNCFSGCFLNVHVRDGQVVRTTARDLPDTSYNRICTKGLTHTHRIYSAKRLQYPMKRVGERGSGEFERISWDEAMDTIVQKWKEYTGEYGPSAFGVYTGSGSYGIMSGSQTYGCAMQRFINATGASFINFNVDLAGLTMSGITSSGVSGGVSASNPDDLKNADYVFVASNAEVSQPHLMHFIWEAMDQGTKFIVMDPRFTYLAGRAYKYVPVNPSTDAALDVAILKVIFDKGWENKEFMKQYSTMPFLVKDEDGQYLTTADLDVSLAPEDAKECVLTEDGQILPWDAAASFALGGRTTTENGIAVTTVYDLLQARLAEYDTQELSRICGISMDDIEELADIWANGGKVAEISAPGRTHYTNGGAMAGGSSTLQIVCGQIGESGRGPVCGTSSGAIFDMAGASLMLDESVPGGAFGFHQFMGHGLDVTVMDKVMDENRFGDTEVHLKGMFLANVNPLVAAADHSFMIDWFNKVEFIAMMDMNMNETARYADILLPAAHWFEIEDIFNSFASHPYALFQEKAIEPPFEARSDYDVIKELAEALGVGEYFDMTPEEYMDFVMNTDAAKSSGISYASLKENKAMLVLSDDEFVFADNRTFGTPYNRVTAYLPERVPMGNSGQEFDPDLYRMVFYKPADEVDPDNPNKEKFPYILISPHSRFRTHSQWWDVEPLKELDEGVLWIRINNEDAGKLGIADGDKVKVYNDRGYLVGRAAITAGLMPGNVSMDGCWEDSEVEDGAVNALTGHHSDPFVRDTAFYDVIVAIEKVA